MNFDLHFYDSLTSTMDTARDRASHLGAEGLVIQAGQQTDGRGRHGNPWSSPTGNLYQSLVLHPSVEKQYWGQLSFVIGLALVRAIEDAMGTLQIEVSPRDSLKLKWPNDVLVDGRKIAGILVETGDDFVIVGTGVNIAVAPEGAIALQDIAEISLQDFQAAFLKQIARLYTTWQIQGFAPIRAAWLGYAYKLNTDITARMADRSLNGVFTGLDDHGGLLLRLNDGSVKTILSGEIINHAARD